MIKQINMTRKLILPILVTGMLFISSCTTYLIPIDSFKAQFSGIDSTRFNEVSVKGPFGEAYKYLANPLKSIKCEDKKGNAHEISNGPSIEIRFTHGVNNKKTIYYFDRIYVNDIVVEGVQSSFISSIRKTIPLKDITKIEIQDGDGIVFYGDSITHQRLYTQYVEDYFYTRFPTKRLRLHNAGVSGSVAWEASSIMRRSNGFFEIDFAMPPCVTRTTSAAARICLPMANSISRASRHKLLISF